MRTIAQKRQDGIVSDSKGASGEKILRRPLITWKR